MSEEAETGGARSEVQGGQPSTPLVTQPPSRQCRRRTMRCTWKPPYLVPPVWEAGRESEPEPLSMKRGRSRAPSEGRLPD
jgi:hypothetical protein